MSNILEPDLGPNYNDYRLKNKKQTQVPWDSVPP